MYSRIKNIIIRNNIRLSTLRSQHFLINENIIKKEVEVGDVNRKDTIVEVGAGIGNLTKYLAERAKKVIAIEKDARFVQILKNELKNYDNVEIINEDILKLENSIFDNHKIISNPPYHISSPLLVKILESNYQICIITLQWEFGQRLIAKPNTSNYSRITIKINYNAEVKFIRKISKNNFYPVPKVDSVLLKIVPKTPIVKIDNEKPYFQIINFLFNHKNQQLQKVIKNKLRKKGVDMSIINKKINRLPYKELRVRELDHFKLKDIYNYIYNEMKGYWNI